MEPSVDRFLAEMEQGTVVYADLWAADAERDAAYETWTESGATDTPWSFQEAFEHGGGYGDDHGDDHGDAHGEAHGDDHE
jgi:hypothetical protein